MEELNVCCPYLRTKKCSDTKEHRHLVCLKIGDVITNSDVVYWCVGDKYILCGNYNLQYQGINKE